MQYNKFIDYLKSLNSLDEIFNALYFYFIYFVEYDYDQLQIIKFIRYYENPLFLKIIYHINKIKKGVIPYNEKELLNMLDKAFKCTDGTPLTEKNKQKWLKNFNEKLTLNLKDYAPIYIDDMLRKGVCGEISVFVKKILDDLDIFSLIAIGKNTTAHAWNVVYDEEKNKWINLDVTMVKFYLDKFIKNCENPKRWIDISFKDMFKVQPTREIYQLINKDNIIFDFKITKENYYIIEDFLINMDLNSLKKDTSNF